jgi:serine/threonine-protein kinase
MAVELNPRALGKDSGESAAAPLAYESYLKGLSYLERYDKAGNLDTAIQLFENAVKTDPSFALAFARLAEAQWIKNRNNPDPKLVEQAIANSRRAEQINDQLAPVHVTLGRLGAAKGKIRSSGAGVPAGFGTRSAQCRCLSAVVAGVRISG